MGYSAKEIKTASMFRGDVWPFLLAEQRREAVKKLVQISAKELGHEPPDVIFEPLNGFTSGFQKDGVVHYNSYLVDDDRYVIINEKGEEESSFAVHNSGAETMNVTFHEDTHAHQDAVAENKVDLSEIDPRYVRDMSAGGRISTYIDPNFNYILYRVQPQELEAFARGNQKTVEMLRETEKYLGIDPQLDGYIETISGEEEKAITEVRTLFADSEAEEALAAAIRDKYYGTNEALQYQSGVVMQSILESSYQYNMRQSISMQSQNIGEIPKEPHENEEESYGFENTSFSTDLDEQNKEVEKQIKEVQYQYELDPNNQTLNEAMPTQEIESDYWGSITSDQTYSMDGSQSNDEGYSH